MSSRSRALVILPVLLAWTVAVARAEVLVRWDQDHVPSPDSLGISTLLIPITNSSAVQDAVRKGYRVYVEVEASLLPTLALPAGARGGVVVKGAASPRQLRLLRRRLTAPGARVLSLDERGKWPHIRLNWVTRRNDVLQVSSRSAQPWIENNGALVRVAQVERADATPLLGYAWTPITISDMHAGPTRENYLVAIAEAGSFGGDLVLPLHEGLQRGLLMGRPEVRADWQEMRRYLEFYSWDLPRRYRPISNIGIVTADALRSFEVLNLLTRHNLPFEIIAPAQLSGRNLDALDLLIVLDQPDAAQVTLLSAFVQRAKTVVLTGLQGPFPWHDVAPVQKTEQQVSYRAGGGRVLELLQPVADPNAFALQIRELLGPGARVIDVWNGITVITVPYQDPGGATVLVALLNYAHETTPVQLRVRGTFSSAHYEAPETEPVLVPLTHRDGYTELVLPALRIGGRVFLTRDAARQ